MSFFERGMQYAQNLSYFSFSDSYNQVYDYRNGFNLEKIQDFRNLNNIDKIKRVIITSIDMESHQWYELLYNNGLLTSENSHDNELKRLEFEYDNSRRLVKEGDNFIYKYISDSIRECYSADKKVSVENISENKSSIKISRKKYTVSLKSNDMIEDGIVEEEFLYDTNNSLISYSEERWYSNGKKSQKTKNVQFYYNKNNKLEKIISGYNTEIMSISNVFYNSYNLMDSIIVNDLVSNFEYKIIFSEYDKYGNWHRSEMLDGKEVVETVIREIFYLQ